MFFATRAPIVLRRGVRLVDAKQGAVTAGGSTTILMPTNRFDVLVLAITAAGEEDPQLAPSISGFTSLATQTTSGRPRQRMSYCVNPGASATLTLNSTTRNAAYQLLAFLGAKLDEAPAVSTAGNDTQPYTTPNAPSRTSLVDGCEFVAAGSIINTTVDTSWGAPSGYSDLRVQSAGDSSGQNAVLMSARKNLASAGADDPGAFTHGSVTGGWVAMTAVIKPAT